MKIFLQVFCVGVTFVNTTVGFDNLAQNSAYKGVASQSSIHDGNKWLPEQAVDGRQDTCSFTRAWVNTKAWWKFTLKQLANIAYLEVYFRNITKNRHTGFNVFVFNNSSYIPPSKLGCEVFTQNPSSCPSRVMNVTVNKLTKGIAIFNSKYPPLNTSCEGYQPLFASIEICEVMIMGCHFQHYGEKCTSCSLKCSNQECDAFNGSCIYGCSNSLMEPPGCATCKSGYYGHNCEQTCGKCKTGTKCNYITGICPNGCQKHWNGSKCAVCENGFYGDNCTQLCSHCKPGTHCHNMTGVCQEGCDYHWDGPQCKVCADGYYGVKCENNCRQCLTGAICNPSSGVCPTGCKENWTGPKCDECQDHKYGPNCAFDCGHCKNGKPCSKMNGKCGEGCELGWTGLYCLKILSSTGDLQAGEGISKTSSVVLSIVSTLLVVTIICIGVRVVYNKRKRRNSHRGKEHTDNVPAKCYGQISKIKDDHTYQEINSSSGHFTDQEMHVYDNTEFVDSK